MTLQGGLIIPLPNKCRSALQKFKFDIRYIPKHLSVIGQLGCAIFRQKLIVRALVILRFLGQVNRFRVRLSVKSSFRNQTKERVLQICNHYKRFSPYYTSAEWVIQGTTPCHNVKLRVWTVLLKTTPHTTLFLSVTQFRLYLLPCKYCNAIHLLYHLQECLCYTTQSNRNLQTNREKDNVLRF